MKLSSFMKRLLPNRIDKAQALIEKARDIYMSESQFQTEHLKSLSDEQVQARHEYNAWCENIDKELKDAEGHRSRAEFSLMKLRGI